MGRGPDLCADLVATVTADSMAARRRIVEAPAPTANNRTRVSADREAPVTTDSSSAMNAPAVPSWIALMIHGTDRDSECWLSALEKTDMLPSLFTA